jgi:hypothetical protein
MPNRAELSAFGFDINPYPQLHSFATQILWLKWGNKKAASGSSQRL